MIAIESMREPKSVPGDAEAPSAPRCASDLAALQGAVSPAHTNKEVILFFKDHPDQASLPVVEEGIPIGIINRSIFLTGFSMPFHREIYERKSCIAFMDKSPLIVDGELAIAELGKLAVAAGAKVLQDGFIVTRQGRFSGLGTGLDLLRAMGQMEAERNRVIRESIDYAQIIQGALLATSLGELSGAGLPDQYLLWKPRDQVGGDAFFARRVARDGHQGLFLALMDCTGHGVPGAFTAMLMTSFLGHALDLALPWEPGEVLAKVNRRVKEELGQKHQPDDAGSFESTDGRAAADEGMDVTCLWMDRLTGEVIFAGARHSLWVFRPGAAEPEEIKGDRIGVGYTSTPDNQAWTSQTLRLPAGTTLVGTTDGIVDQIGGPKRIAFGKRRLWEAFRSGAAGAPLQSRLEHACAAMAAYQGTEPRRDDVCLLAMKL
jgi:serine phosphatase RsbU (regulator of sigma subunit)